MITRMLMILIGLIVWTENFAQNQERLNMIEQYIEQSVADGIIPGGVFKLNVQGETIIDKTIGHVDTDKNRPYAEDDIFRIASMTKAITSVSIMQLYENGRLLIDDPVSKYIPEFGQTKVLDTFNEADSTYTVSDLERPLTIRHLMTHTSGIYYGQGAPGKYGAVYAKNDALDYGLSHYTASTEEMVAHIASLPLAHQPGERWTYGLNMEVMGRIVEIVSGMGLEEYFEQNIFEPLGMDDTHFNLPDEKGDRLVPVYMQLEEGTIMNEDERMDYPLTGFDNHFAGGGGLVSTAADYLKFVRALVNGGRLNGQRILGRKTIDYMRSAQTNYLAPAPNGHSRSRGNGFGLGFAVVTEEGQGAQPFSTGTYSWGGYFNTKFWIDPEEEMVFVGMTQLAPFKHGEFWDKLYALIYSVLD